MDANFEHQDLQSKPNQKRKKEDGSGFGLAKKVSMQRFDPVGKELEGYWNGLNTEARVEHFTENEVHIIQK